MVEPKVIKSPGVGEDRPEARLYYGQDVRESLRQLGERSVHAVCTSPPYWGLRDYGVEPSVWGGTADCGHDWQDSTCSRCGAWRGQLGLEPTPELYVQHLVEVFREVRRVLRDDGTLWLNLGDCYAQAKGHGQWESASWIGDEHGQKVVQRWAKTGAEDLGLKPKDLVGIPWMVAFALRSDGWFLRSSIPWIKRNAMPSSVTDRPGTSHENVFLLSKSSRYFYDGQAVRKPSTMKPQRRFTQRTDHPSGDRAPGAKLRQPHYPPDLAAEAGTTPDGMRSRRDVDWFMDSIGDILSGGEGMLTSESGEPLAFVVNPRPYKGAHFATWPPKLVEPMVLASTSAGGACSSCGAPLAPSRTDAPEDEDVNPDVITYNVPGRAPEGGVRVKDVSGAGGYVLQRKRYFSGYGPTCSCNAGLERPVVLDLFSGSGTTGVVALGLGRDYVGIDLNQNYLDLAVERITGSPEPKTDAHTTDEMDFSW